MFFSVFFTKNLWGEWLLAAFYRLASWGSKLKGTPKMAGLGWRPRSLDSQSQPSFHYFIVCSLTAKWPILLASISYLSNFIPVQEITMRILKNQKIIVRNFQNNSVTKNPRKNNKGSILFCWQLGWTEVVAWGRQLLLATLKSQLLNVQPFCSVLNSHY